MVENIDFFNSSLSLVKSISGDKLKIRGTDLTIDSEQYYSLYDLSGKVVKNLMFKYNQDHWESERIYQSPGAYILKITLSRLFHKHMRQPGEQDR